MEFDSNAPDLYVELARYSLETLIAENELAELPAELPEELVMPGHGAFVSLHRRGKLRGCVGTLDATKPTIAEEIMNNARSAATRDPRFPEVRAVELDELEYSVDVLTVPERAEVEDLDPHRYGVILRQGLRVGVLLPNLDGIDTVQDQLTIAVKKAGITDWTELIEISRFEVVRHTLGGEPRHKG